jgi:hypothetical protein
MNVVASLLLRAKHWQIFFLLFGIFIVGDVAVMSSMSAAARSPQDFVKIGPLFGAVLVLSMFCTLAWFWSMGSFLSSMVPPPLRLKIGFFRFALTYPALYIFIFIALFQSISTRPALLAIIFPLHFFAVFCMFYDLYFVSKNLVLAETSKSPSFYEYAGPFFLIWFFPVGVWFIQPRINRLYGQPALSLTEVEPETPPAAVAVPIPTRGSDACGVSVEKPTVYAGFWFRVVAALIGCLSMFIRLFIITFIVFFISNLTDCIGYLMCGFTKKKQALHDMIASCLVLRRP